MTDPAAELSAEWRKGQEQIAACEMTIKRLDEQIDPLIKTVAKTPATSLAGVLGKLQLASRYSGSCHEEDYPRLFYEAALADPKRIISEAADSGRPPA